MAHDPVMWLQVVLSLQLPHSSLQLLPYVRKVHSKKSGDKFNSPYLQKYVNTNYNCTKITLDIIYWYIVEIKLLTCISFSLRYGCSKLLLTLLFNHCNFPTNVRITDISIWMSKIFFFIYKDFQYKTWYLYIAITVLRNLIL